MINIDFGDLLKGIGKFVAKYWQTIALIGLVVFLFSSRNNYGALQDSFEIAVSSYEGEIAALKALYTEELEKRDEALENYEETLNQLTENYNNTRDDLQKARKERTATHVRDFEEQPDKLASEISETFGIEYVE